LAAGGRPCCHGRRRRLTPDTCRPLPPHEGSSLRARSPLLPRPQAAAHTGSSLVNLFFEWQYSSHSVATGSSLAGSFQCPTVTDARSRKLLHCHSKYGLSRRRYLSATTRHCRAPARSLPRHAGGTVRHRHVVSSYYHAQRRPRQLAAFSVPRAAAPVPYRTPSSPCGPAARQRPDALPRPAPSAGALSRALPPFRAPAPFHRANALSRQRPSFPANALPPTPFRQRPAAAAPLQRNSTAGTAPPPRPQRN